MGEVSNILKKYKVDSVHRSIENGRQKFLCFTHVKEADDSWVVVVTDGVDVWKNEYDEDALKAQCDLVSISPLDAFLRQFRSSFAAGELSVAMIGTKMTLAVGKGGSTISFDLFEAKAAEKRSELQTVIFRLAEQNLQLEEKLSVVQESLEKARAQKAGTSGVNLLMDVSPKKSQAKARPRKTGMSVVNPTSRKRKAATGVIYD